LAVTRMEAGEPLESALDYMIQRELNAAKKEDRKPVFESPIMYDECKSRSGVFRDIMSLTDQISVWLYRSWSRKLLSFV